MLLVYNSDCRKLDSTRNLVSLTNNLQGREREYVCEKSGNIEQKR